MKVGDLVKRVRKRHWATGSDRRKVEESRFLPKEQHVLGLVIHEAKTIRDRMTVMCRLGVQRWFYKNCDLVLTGTDSSTSNKTTVLQEEEH
jgi:hypothetical protein